MYAQGVFFGKIGYVDEEGISVVVYPFQKNVGRRIFISIKKLDSALTESEFRGQN